MTNEPLLCDKCRIYRSENADLLDLFRQYIRDEIDALNEGIPMPAETWENYVMFLINLK
jgi:hypothetical protein